MQPEARSQLEAKIIPLFFLYVAYYPVREREKNESVNVVIVLIYIATSEASC